MTTLPLAHRGSTPTEDQFLEDHLVGTARRARRYGRTWGGSHAFITGLWHDLGKYQAAFQRYLLAGNQRRGTITHSTAGAMHLLAKLQTTRAVTIDRLSQIPSATTAMMMAIMAHHGKLPNSSRFEERLGLTTPDKIAPGVAEYRDSLAMHPPTEILDHDLSGICDDCRDHHPLLARMLLSVLVDADVADSSGRKAARLKPIHALKTSFDRFVAALAAQPERTEIDILRAEVLAVCLAKASCARGFFALDAPTGFGKTFSSLGFALEHARLHRFDRIIYVAPFLTAIEQTAAAFRDALNVTKERGNLTQFTVLEDHSTAERDAERAAGDSSSGTAEDVGFVVRDRLRENWEARVIVTSNVQFLESLHAHDRGRCRKLHRIANAVVLMDEPQSIPISLFAPTVNTLQELVRSYRTSIVFVTATQPAFKLDAKFIHGIPHIEPILPTDLLERLRTVAVGRVTVSLPVWDDPELSLEDVAAKVVRRETSTLCIVNTRADAAALYRLVAEQVEDKAAVFHLSASMCSDHRTEVLKTIRGCLKAKTLIRVISTQVVEAGIDIDFPVVMRSMAGLDSLIQSAGRCNRGGTLDYPGDFEVFRLTGGVPHMFRLVVAITMKLLKRGEGLFDAATADKFYRQVREAHCKGEHLLKAQMDWNMTQVGTEYRLIEPTQTVVVPFGERGSKKVAQLLGYAAATLHDSEREGLFSGLSGVTVSVHESAGARLLQAGEVIEIGAFGLLVAVQDWGRPYDMGALGLIAQNAEAMLVEENEP